MPNSTPSPVKTQADSSPFAATIGLDWADERHAICVRHHDDGSREMLTVPHQPAELEAWITRLPTRHPARRVALAVEHGRSAVLYALLEHQDFITLFPVPPQAIHAYRQAVRTTSGAKSDPADAELIEDYLYRHGDALRPWREQDDTTRLLQGLTERRRHLVDERTRLTNAMLADLKLAYPVVPAIFEHLGSPAALAFLRRWPTLASLRKATRQTLRTFFIAQHWRNNESLEQKLDLIAAARPLVTDAVVVQLATTGIHSCAAQLRALLPLISSLEKQISAAYAQHPASAIFNTLPGAGRALAPRLAALFGTDKERWPDARSLQVFTGVAPCTQQSGRIMVVSKRWACPRFLRQTLHEFARLSMIKCPWARAHVEAQSSVASPTTLPCAPWPSNGCASSGGCGTTTCPTAKAPSPLLRNAEASPPELVNRSTTHLLFPLARMLSPSGIFFMGTKGRFSAAGSSIRKTAR